MIKANELRVGNWVVQNIQTSCGVLKCTTPIGLLKHNEDLDIEPIPLTAEILEKAGFVDNIQMLKPIDLLSGRERFHIGKNDDYATIVCGRAPNLVWLQFPCKHLHQLQNLYFALTGKELEINL